MMVDALIARMTQDAQARVAAVRAAADAEVGTLEEARAQAASCEREQTLASRRAARQHAFEVERAAAQRRAAALVLTAQHAFLDRVFARAELLAADACSDPRYVEALPRHVATVVGFLGGRSATLRCAGELAARVRPVLADLPHVELVADDRVPAGLVVEARDGSCTIDCTLPVRLSAWRPQLEAPLLARVPR